MILRFYGTKGYVKALSPSHSGHSAFAVEAGGFRLLCDFGENRKGRLDAIGPDAIFISHAHPVHAWGLAEGTEVPVLASESTHALLSEYALPHRVRLEPGQAESVGPFRLTAFAVAHSTRCPGMAARVETPEGTLVYSGDIVGFEGPGSAEQILKGADLHVGDGSTLTASLVRRHASGALLGHTTVAAQLAWLAKAGVGRAFFSHFGEGPVVMGDDALACAIEDLARAKAPGCEVSVARDGGVYEVP